MMKRVDPNGPTMIFNEDFVSAQKIECSCFSFCLFLEFSLTILVLGIFCINWGRIYVCPTGSDK